MCVVVFLVCFPFFGSGRRIQAQLSCDYATVPEGMGGHACLMSPFMFILLMSVIPPSSLPPSLGQRSGLLTPPSPPLLNTEALTLPLFSWELEECGDEEMGH